MRNEKLIREVLADFYVAGRAYHSPLPPPLADWYCYCSDGGHCVLVVLAADFVPTSDLTGKLVPAPVRAVLRGWQARAGYIVADLRYSEQFGLQTDPSDDEF